MFNIIRRKGSACAAKEFLIDIQLLNADIDSSGQWVGHCMFSYIDTWCGDLLFTVDIVF